MRRYTRRQKRTSNDLLLIAIFAFIAASGLVGAQFSEMLASSGFIIFGALLVVILFLVAFVAYFRRKQALHRKKAFTLLEDIDHMSGVEFEGYVEALLQMKGYKTKTTPTSGDLGIDLIASKDSVRIAVQIKRYSHPVDRRAVSDAVAGMKHYKCHKAMVITNNYFRPGAKQLAESNRCVLLDRDQLASWIADFQTS